jgi:hypothetical protein
MEDDPCGECCRRNPQAGFVALEACDADNAMAIPVSRKDINWLFPAVAMPGSRGSTVLF